jgi:hypothetical protein
VICLPADESPGPPIKSGHPPASTYPAETCRGCPSPLLGPSAKSLTWIGMETNNRDTCQVSFLSIFRFVRLLSGHGAVAMENAALRVQLAAFQKMRKRAVLTTFDRLFWVGLSRVWRGWRSPLLYVKPDTVIRWQRERFRRFWARLSQPQRRRRGRPTIAAEMVD